MNKVLSLMICFIAIIIIITLSRLDFIDDSIGASISSMIIMIWVVLHTQNKTDERFLRQYKNNVQSEASNTILEKEEMFIEKCFLFSEEIIRVVYDFDNLFPYQNLTNDDQFKVENLISSIRFKFVMFENNLMYIKYLSGYCGNGVNNKFNDLRREFFHFHRISERVIYTINKKVGSNNHFDEEHKVTCKQSELYDALQKLVITSRECIAYVSNRENSFKQHIRDLATGFDTLSNNQK
ncbi:hypothetical protein [Shewanella surugensis]|uniref:Uncharacterized protein n=1 Tax=Shewanella surugensis TaxID=212020 RepID=A0ABT0LK93_9GAMM|nr:hypothetical protein [Shewanella surugensis]MCL1127795.1 hypothetical protein [Shewanella surugensis]